MNKHLEIRYCLFKNTVVLLSGSRPYTAANIDLWSFGASTLSLEAADFYKIDTWT